MTTTSPEHWTVYESPFGALTLRGGARGLTALHFPGGGRPLGEAARDPAPFTEEPTERFYGIDCGLRDPFGNHLRLTQPTPGPIVVPDPAEFASG